ncbi:DNA internalization-related competence protein ComEC/Rec2 [Paraferrimonas sedimenticola]|uniref:ComEC family protein n=1 Tax=Paraferrimonas sedimenticola TaxID=375674 RepID=A0AA37RT68_9GAMM|nr:DNA internalization-related competence protein ComEC/Rec2 [Paraferrimonas sedimenticola]GLP94881.1 ComEC family protein [Paraferrimonas sedimenticola]
MDRILLGFTAAVLSGTLWPSLGGFQLTIVLLFAFIITLWFKLWPLAATIFGVLWFHWHASELWWYPHKWLQNSTEIQAKILALNDGSHGQVRLDIGFSDQRIGLFQSPQARVYWLEPPPELQVGQHWRLLISAKPNVSPLNQGADSAQRLAYSRYQVARGRVIGGELISPDTGWRQKAVQTLETQFSALGRGDLLLALSSGERRLLSPERWQSLRNSGTTHLIAISGLHLGVAMGACWLLFRWLMPMSWLNKGAFAYQSTVALAWVCASAYAWLSGFAIATQRAWLMLSLVFLLGLLMRHLTRWDRLLIALAGVLLLDPMAGLGASLWLSFGALATIFCWMERVPEQYRSGWRGLVTLQLSVGLITSVIALLCFDGLAPHGFWVNLILVPLFSLLIIPVCLLCLPWLLWGGPGTEQMASGLDAMLIPIEALINYSASLPAGWLSGTEQQTHLAIIVLASALVLVFRRDRVALVLVGICWCSLLPGLSRIPTWRFHMLDVGQGLSVVIQQQNRALVYDTGASFPFGYSYQAAVLQPFLRHRGISHLDYLVVSHGDNDHAGGAAALLRHYPEALLISDLAVSPAEHEHQRHCRPGTIQWQALTIEILAPKVPDSSNDGSCVIRINDGHYRLLLPGDIETDGEVRLLRQDLSAQFLLAPHHGSRTSSRLSFLQKVDALHVFISNGYRHRFGMPHAEALQRYRELGLAVWRSDLQGQVSVSIYPNDYQIHSLRDDLQAYWYNGIPPFGDRPKSE